MTTIDLDPIEVNYLRGLKNSALQHYGSTAERMLVNIANRLPDPPYVPSVGDRVRVYDLAADDSRSYYQGEQVMAVVDGFVITEEGDSHPDRPAVWAYRIDAHRFEKVEQ